MIQLLAHAGVMELADVSDSKSDGSDTVSVRPRSPAPASSYDEVFFFFKFNLSFQNIMLNIVLLIDLYH